MYACLVNPLAASCCVQSLSFSFLCRYAFMSYFRGLRHTRSGCLYALLGVSEPPGRFVSVRSPGDRHATFITLSATCPDCSVCRSCRESAQAHPSQSPSLIHIGRIRPAKSAQVHLSSWQVGVKTREEANLYSISNIHFISS
ncbi:hypothetical protein AMECASPLE_022248 [Ameca splendens]|uniref:Secreted protein n=1 Tax=Ameca splendens TaxID=208324 RepID=A0ABV0ZNX7_9TELE